MNSHYFQHSLSESITFVGRGLHSGLPVRMMLQPAEADTGILFIRHDVPAYQAEIQARWHNVTDTRLSTTISNRYGVKVSTIEHLMAALYACGIDNARVVINGPEVPIMDGSAGPFVQMINQAGTVRQHAERRAIVIRRAVRLEENGKSAALVPAPRPWIDMTIDFENPGIGHQYMSVPMERELFAQEVAAARTFGFADQIETLRKLGLAKGGSLRNAVLVDENGVVNQDGLRFDNEFVRHKVLDAVGDLALAGATIVGRFVGNCSGHGMNNKLLRALLQNEDAWHYTTVQGAEQYWTWTRAELLNGTDVRLGQA